MAMAAVSAGQPVASASRGAPHPKCSTNTNLLVIDTGLDSGTGGFVVGTSYLGQVTATVNNPVSPEATAVIDLRNCSQADIVVEYDSPPNNEPTGWTVDLGDSPCNDGFGGDCGTTSNDTEAQILNNTLAVYASDLFNPSSSLRFTGGVALADGAIKFVVKNQYLGSGGPANVLFGPGLYQISPPDPADGSKIYLGINRVICCDANPSGGRTGNGVARVMITLH
jgi:hypothetical protein